MIYILDTNLISYMEDPESPFHESVTNKLGTMKEYDKICISILSLYEYEYGISCADEFLSRQLVDTKKTMLELFDILPLSLEGSEIFGEIKAAYRQATGISQKAIDRHNVDFMLASTAISAGGILVSRDGIFDQLQKMRIDFFLEDWTDEAKNESIPPDYNA